MCTVGALIQDNYAPPEVRRILLQGVVALVSGFILWNIDNIMW